MMAQRHGDLLAERLAQRLDQRRIGQNALDLFAGDDAHQVFLRMVLPENRYPLFGIMR